MTPKLVSDAGLEKGSPIVVEYNHSNGIPTAKIVSKVLKGKKQLSVVGTARGNVIDLNNAAFSEHFKEYKEVEIVISGNTIRIKGALGESRVYQREEQAIEKLSKGSPLLIGSLCSGIDVLCKSVHEGLQKSGIKTSHMFSNEIEEAPAELSYESNPIWKNKHPKAVFFQGDIFNLNSRLIPKLDIVVVGYPCTPFSKLNNNRETRDVYHPIAGTMFQPTLSFISSSNPFLVIMEETPLYLKSITDHIMTDVMDRFGYTKSALKVKANDFGDFELRERACVIWYSRNLPQLDIDKLNDYKNKNTRPLSEILTEIDLDSDKWRVRKYLENKDAETHNSHRYCKMTGHEVVTPILAGNYAKSQPDSPHITHPLDSSKTRLITEGEHCSIRDIDGEFKDSIIQYAQGRHSINVRKSTQITKTHRFLGNSVGPKCWKNIGSWLGDWINTVGEKA
jgi:DNA (cytosine-5)-methyltransferase 1